jgi:5-methyltetrahydrofolate--homocysteine methyltransferase
MNKKSGPKSGPIFCSYAQRRSVDYRFSLPGFVKFEVKSGSLFHPLSKPSLFTENKEPKIMDAILQEIYDAIINGDPNTAADKVQAGLQAGLEPGIILNDAMVAAMAQVGRLFEEGEYFVPEMLIAARAMKAGMALLKPQLVKANVQSSGKVVIGTVKGDLHDIGKNLVAMMLEGAAFEIIDLGTDVAPEKFIDAIKDKGAQLVAMSALLTTTMPGMKTTIEAIKTAGLRDQVKIMVGGAPLTEQYAHQIGADGFSPDASRAIKVAKSLLEG